jgi:hypothetical protein
MCAPRVIGTDPKEKILLTWRSGSFREEQKSVLEIGIPHPEFPLEVLKTDSFGVIMKKLESLKVSIDHKVLIFGDYFLSLQTMLGNMDSTNIVL